MTMENLKEYSLLIFTEDTIGMLNRVNIVFTRRKLNIESITASETEIKGIYRYTIILTTTLKMIKHVVKQLEKQIEVLKAFYYEADDTIYEEIALYKISTEAFKQGISIEKIVRENFAKVICVEPDFLVIEKTGKKSETQELYNVLEPYGILEFARSGYVSLSKPIKKLTEYLKELEAGTDYSKRYENQL